LAGAAALAVYAAPAQAQQAISTPILKSVTNFRDLAGISASNGGTGFADTTANSGVMRTDVFYRSNALTLSGADLATASSLGITKDIDLRTPGEIASTPDVVPTGATYLNINILGSGSAATSSVATAKSAAEVVTAMEGMYRGFVTDPTDRAGFRETLLQMAQTPGAILYHCTSGKDRTGWASAILQTIAGVAPDTIMKDYLATNSYSAGSLAILKLLPAGTAAIFAPALGVQASFLQASLDQVTASYGSMQAYLTQGLGLTQADIYVLRARMVDFLVLPGQAGFVGNSAQGAALLNNLQNSPLSGAYTAYNFYLQSAIDAGSLGGVEARVGGQVHADSVAYLLREPQRISAALDAYSSGKGLEPGKTSVWQADLGQNFHIGSDAFVAGSRERNAGALLGATHRFDGQNSAYVGLGYNWGQVSSAGADADVNAFVATLGGRHGFQSLDQGAYVAGGLSLEVVDYKADRPLGEGLGTAHGSSNGDVYAGRVELGDVITRGVVTLNPLLAVEVAHAKLDGFTEQGSELALDVGKTDQTTTSLEAGLRASFASDHVAGWTVTPSAEASYVRFLSDPSVDSEAQIFQYGVSQRSAFNSRNLGRMAVDLTARRGPFSVQAGINGLVGGDDSSGVGGRIVLGYSF
jgi:protein tyrosine/serine phosphatase